MEELKSKIIMEAIEQYGTINPVALKNAFNECFTTIEDKLVFWFNDCTGSTRVIMKEFICQQ